MQAQAHRVRLLRLWVLVAVFWLVAGLLALSEYTWSHAGGSPSYSHWAGHRQRIGAPDGRWGPHNPAPDRPNGRCDSRCPVVWSFLWSGC